MLYEQVTFTVDEAQPGFEPVRLDVTLFLGLLAVRDGAVPPPSLQDQWRREGYLAHDATAQTGADLIDRPVAVSSLAAAEALFDLDKRVDRPAVITGGAVPMPLTFSDDAFAVTLDGDLQEISLTGAPTDLVALAAFLDERLIGVSVGTSVDRLKVWRTDQSTAGTLAILSNPGLGFHMSLHVRASAVTTAMGAALRQFFDMGGQRAVILSLGQPPAVLADADQRAAMLATLLDIPVDGVIDAARFGADFKAPHIPAPQRSGLSHLFGLENVGQMLLPDLPDLLSGPRDPAPDLPDPLRPVAAFAACLPPAAALARGEVVDVERARLNAAGQALWDAAIARMTTFLAAYRRDVGLIAAVSNAKGPHPRSPHLTLAGPWVKTPRSDQMPGGVMAADAVFAGHLARHLRGPAPHGNAAANPVQQLRTVDPGPRLDGVCWIAKGPRNFQFTGDVTTDVGGIWASGPARRVMARLLKEADRMGALILFEPISDALMARVEGLFGNVLAEIARAGGLIPADRDPGYTVVCNRTNNTAQDRDNGRLRADVGFRPAPSIQMIAVTLDVGQIGGTA